MRLDQEKLDILQKIKADKLFPSLLTSDEKKKIKTKRKVKKVATVKKVADDTHSADVPSTKEILSTGVDFDLKNLVKSSIDSKTGKMRELVDTRSLPEAKNFYDYCYRILGSDIHPPWAIQMWLATMALGEVCPRCTNPKYMDVFQIDKKMSSKDLNSKKRMTFLEHGVCPRCGATRKEILENNELPNYDQAVFILGQRSGKSTTAAIMASYVLHRYLMYPVLSSMTDSMQASTELVFIFCSLTYQKAYDVLWTPFKNIINTAQWFKSYFQLLDQYKEQFGKELYVKGESVISFANKNIKCYPVGPTASRLRGNTAIMTVLDELGLFPLPRFDEVVDENDTNRRASADEAYTSLTNSLTTVEAARNELIRKGFNDAPPCLMLSVSSPVSKRDKVMRLYADSKTNPYIFAVRMATWQVNPHLEITSGPIASAFKTSERKALRDFGAQPAEGAAPYFPEEVVTQCFVGRPNSHTLQYQYDEANHFVWGTVRSVNQYRGPTVMALDAGLVNNSFAIAVVGYNEKTHQTETVCVLEVIANDNNMVNFENLYRFVILPLCEQLNVCLVVADRWNSIDHLHRIRSDRGLRQGKPITYVKQYSLKVKDFEAVRALMSNHSVLCPAISKEWQKKILDGQIGDYKRELFGRPVEHFFMQLLTVNDLGPGLCPSKAEGLTDDIARAWILAVSTINKEKVVELIDHNRKFIQSTKSAFGRGVVAVGRSF